MEQRKPGEEQEANLQESEAAACSPSNGREIEASAGANTH